MSTIAEQIRTWSGEALQGSDYFIYDVKISGDQTKIWVFVDSDTGVNIDRCTELNQYINEKLDAWNPEHGYGLEVSSPGADRPLRFIRQYPKHIGRKLELKLKDGKVKTNMLKAVNADSVVIGEKITNLLTKRKPKPDEEIAFDEIDEAHVVIPFS